MMYALKLFLLCVIFVILILFSLYFNFYENFTLKNTSYEDYRLGDFIKGWIFNNQKHKQKNILEKFPNSLCAKYYNIVKNMPDHKKWNNIEVIDKLLNDINTETPENDTLVINLRLGDAITGYSNGKFTYRGNNYVSTGIYGICIEKLKKFLLSNKSKFKKVTLVYGIHQGASYDLSFSEKYLELLRKFLEENNIKYSERHNENPDLDFAFMCKSKNFMPSGSGFSRLIMDVVKFRKNKIFTVNNKDL